MAAQQQATPKAATPPPHSTEAKDASVLNLSLTSQDTPQELAVDPGACRVWRGNQRAADRLNEASCKDLIDSFLSHGYQHTPAFARRAPGKGGAEYEIVAGSRRLWAANWVRGHHRPDFMFPITLFPNLSDEQAYFLSDSENRDRDDVSDYERAQTYKQVLKAGFYPSQKAMAERYGLSEASLSLYLQLAEIGIQLANAFADWRDLKTYYARPLNKALQNPSSAKRLLRKATELHIVHEERAIADKPPIAGPVVFEMLKRAAKVGRGHSTGPLQEFTKDDKAYLRVRKNQHGITFTVPYANGADIDDMVSSFRSYLTDHYRA